MKLPISMGTIQPCRGSEASAIQTLLGAGARASLPFSHGKNGQQQNQLSMFKLCCHTSLCAGLYYREEMASTPAVLQAAEIVHTRPTITALIHKTIIWSTAGKMSSWKKCRCKTGLMFLQGCYSKASAATGFKTPISHGSCFETITVHNRMAPEKASGG